MEISVDCKAKTLTWAGQTVPCSIGKSGFVPQDAGREGDAKTPLGCYAVRYGLYRQDRMGKLSCALPLYPMQKNDGWCDASDDPAYNRPVRLPYTASAERLWKSSHVYDVILVLGHNDSPPIPDKGSAIFLHIARQGYKPTLGCVAISKRNMRRLLKDLAADTTINITG